MVTTNPHPLTKISGLVLTTLEMLVLELTRISLSKTNFTMLSILTNSRHTRV